MTPRRRSRFPGLEDLVPHAADRRRELIRELVSARLEEGLSQTEIAAGMGTSQSAVARLESGDLDARLSTLERYAAALGRTVDWQLRGAPAPRRDRPGPV
jgi:transcriptional regulator with XRE-family HTH domain